VAQRHGGASRHLQRVHDRIGSFGLAVGAVAAVNLVSSPWPTPFSFIALSDRGLPTRSQLSVLDQDTVKGSELAVGPIRLRSILIFSS
jgi:hypothetical protein